MTLLLSTLFFRFVKNLFSSLTVNFHNILNVVFLSPFMALGCMVGASQHCGSGDAMLTGSQSVLSTGVDMKLSAC